MNIPRKRYVKTFTVVLLLLLLVSAFNPQPEFLSRQTSAASLPPDEDANSGGNGTGEFKGTWYIGSGESIARANQTLNLTGDIIINNTGRLVLTNFTLNLNNSYNGQFMIHVRSGGRLEINSNSTITTKNPNARASLVVDPGGSIVVNSSFLNNLGWNPDDPGIVLKKYIADKSKTNSSISNSSFSNCYAGLTVINYTTNLTIKNNIFKDSVIGFQGLFTEGLVLFNNSFENLSSTAVGLLASSKIKLEANNISRSGTGLESINSTAVLRDNFIFNNSGWGVRSIGSYHEYLNNNFSGPSGTLNNTQGRIIQQSFLGVHISDAVTKAPLEGAGIVIRDLFGTIVSVTNSDLDGNSSGINLTFYQIMNNGSNITFTPHNLTVDKTSYLPGYAVPGVYMGSNTDVSVKLSKNRSTLKVDSIIIESRGGGYKPWVSQGSYGAGYADTFYCAGYNNTYGYTGGVNATWTVSDENLAQVTSPGSETHFIVKTVLQNSQIKVNAVYNSLVNSTGTMDILKATEDYIVITDAPSGNGAWVNDRNLPLDINSTLYCGVFNLTGGYLYDVNATWESYNPYIAQITFNGTVATLSPLALGTTYIEASYISSDLQLLKNLTGRITIIDYTIDQIIIRTQPEDKGLWVGPGKFPISTTLTFYCSSYNTSWGFLKDVPANWKLIGDPVGNLQPTTGKQVSLEGTKVGTVYIDASFAGLGNRTGLLSFFMPLPDLEIRPEDIRFFPLNTKLQEFREATIEITVRNNGGETSGEVDVEVYNSTLPYGDPNEIHNGTLGSFLAYETKSFNITWKPMQIGTEIINVIVDSAGIIFESEESNNFAERSISIIPFIPDLIKIEVEPKNKQIEAGEVAQFFAYGYFNNDTSRQLTGSDVRWSATGGAKVNSTGHFLSVKSGSYNVTATSGRISNKTSVSVVPGPLAFINIYPSNTTVEVGNTKKFYATGYDEYYNEVPIQPSWSVNGGGNISELGIFISDNVGTWTVRADFRNINGTATVIVLQQSIDINRIMIFPSKLVMLLNTEYQFLAVGVDRNGNEYPLKPFWTTSDDGIISSQGIYNATTLGRRKVYASAYGFEGSAEVIVQAAAGIVNIEIFEDPRSSITVKASFYGTGTIWINRFDDLPGYVKIPENFISLGIYVEIASSAEMVLNWAWIQIPYNRGSLSAEAKEHEADTKIYYWSNTEELWYETGESGVDLIETVVFGNTSHFSIYAPFAEIQQPEPKKVEEPSLLWMSIIIAVLVIIILIVIVKFFLIGKGRVPVSDPGLKKEDKQKDSTGFHRRPVRKIIITRHKRQLRGSVIVPIEDEDDGEELEE